MMLQGTKGGKAWYYKGEAAWRIRSVLFWWRVTAVTLVKEDEA